MATVLFPPGPKQRPIWSNLWTFRRDPLAFLMNIRRQYGDISYFEFGPQKVFQLNHPDLIKEVLVVQAHNFVKSRGLERSKRFLGDGLLTSEGETHKRQRRLMQPSFHRQRIASYAQSMVDYGARRRAQWQDGKVVDISQEMMRLTLAIVTKTLFDADVEGEAEEIGQAMTNLIEGFRILVLPFSEYLEKLPIPAIRRVQKGRDRLDQTVFRMINERRASGVDHGDLLSMLLMAQDHEGDGAGMTDKQVRDEVMTLFIAGHETTANALTWTWYLLATHPEVEERVWREIDTVIGTRLPTADDEKELRYTEMVFAEVMRLYPPAWVIGRRAIHDCVIGGQQVPANSIILMSPYVLHHDERFFPNPYKFEPERWRPEAQAARPKYSYFPFGGGPRACIGEPFAWMEGVLLIATIAQQWRMRTVDDHKVETEPLITLRPKHGMPMRLTRRN